MAHELDVLRTVFAYHVVSEVIGADGVKTAEELTFLHRRWPREKLAGMGLVDGSGTPGATFHAALAEALEALPGRLGQDEKLALIETFWDASLADGHQDRNESAAVARAADLLGVPGHVWMAHMERKGDMGTVELDDPDDVDGHLELMELDEDDDTVTPADAPTEAPDDR